MIKRIKAWIKWSKRCHNSWFHKILVLLNLRHSPTFYAYKELTDVQQFKFGDFREWEVTNETK